MNTPIISPWFFYFAGIADALRFSLIILGCTLLFLAIIVLCSSLDEKDDASAKSSIRCIFVGIAIAALGLFCPSEDTCYKIALAKYATPQNIQTVTEYVNDTATNVSDNVTEAIKDIMDYSVDRIYDVRNNQKVGDDE